MENTSRHRHGFRALADTVAALTEPALSKRGLPSAVLLADWPRIVGATLAQRSAPEKLVFPPRRRSEGTLHIRIATSALALELQHAEPVIIERINGYFGFPAVARLRVRHAPLASADATRAPARPGRAGRDDAAALDAAALDATFVDETVNGLADGALKTALLALGRTLKAAPPASVGDDP